MLCGMAFGCFFILPVCAPAVVGRYRGNLQIGSRRAIFCWVLFIRHDCGILLFLCTSIITKETYFFNLKYFCAAAFVVCAENGRLRSFYIRQKYVFSFSLPHVFTAYAIE